MGENADALIAGEVDAVQIFQPLAEKLIEESGMQIWYAAAERGLTSYTTFSTTRAFMAREPESLFRMTCAMYRTQKWIAEHSAKGLRRVYLRILPQFAAGDVDPVARSVSQARYLEPDPFAESGRI